MASASRTGNVPNPSTGDEGKRPNNLWSRVQRARAIAAERAKRDNRGRSRPTSWPKIGKQFGITERQARRIYADFCAWELSQHDPLSTVDESILLREELLYTLGELTDDANNPSARVGAARTMLDVDRERLELMQAVGRVPKNMARFRAETEFAQIVRDVMDVLERKGIDADTLREIQAITEEGIQAPVDNVTPIRAAR